MLETLLQTHIAAALLAFTPPAPALAAYSLAPWHDPSPHQVLHIHVSGPVQLEVLDWGGQGEPLVFLAGGGNTAHVYDGFAPRFTRGFHVFGITRRGFGASSHPSTGTTQRPWRGMSSRCSIPSDWRRRASSVIRLQGLS
jgi:hypothetical protein